MSRTSNGLYEFGTFGLDTERRVLTRAGVVVPVQPKTFELLLLLVQRPGHAFSKKELMAALWPDTFVEEANLSFQISVLRKALGEQGARFVETVPKHGYRLNADMRATIPSDMSSPAPLSANEPSSVVLRHSDRKVWLAGASVTAVLLAVLALLMVGREPRAAGVETSPALAVPLTAYPGFEQVPSLSPDGSQVAFSWNGPALDNYDVYVKLAGPGEPIRLTTNPAPDESPAWSPDGRSVAFLRLTTSGTAHLIVIPALGGAERTIAEIVLTSIPRNVRPLSNLSWTPDGRWLAFGGTTSPNGPHGIWLMSLDGAETQRLTDAPAGGLRDTSPVVSPDGRYLAFRRENSWTRAAIFLLPLTPSGGRRATPRQLTPDDHGVRSLAWTPDGRELLFSTGGHLGLSRLASVSAVPQAGGTSEPEFLPFGEHASGVSISGTGRLVYSAQFSDTELYELKLQGASKAPTMLTAFSSTFDEHTPHYSPDGRRMAFASTRSGSEEIWIANSDGSNLLQMTSMGGPQCANPQWAPDGRTILFNSRRAGSSDLFLMRPDTGTLTRLTSDPAEEGQARWSRDGRWIYFGSNKTGRFEIWRMPGGGGPPLQVTRQGGLSAIESSDGFLYYSKDAGTPSSIWRVPVNGGAEVLVAEGLINSLNLAVGERGLYFVAVNETPNRTSIDFLDFRTRQRSTLVRLDQSSWYGGMTLAPDERSLVYAMVDSAGSNLMLVENFR